MNKYPEVRFNSKAFSKEPPENMGNISWFAGQDLSEAIIDRFRNLEIITLSKVPLIEEDWGWCICLNVGKESFFLGVGEDWDSKRDWKIFIAKDFGFIARIFRKQALQQAIKQLKDELNSILISHDEVTDIVWSSE